MQVRSIEQDQGHNGEARMFADGDGNARFIAIEDVERWPVCNAPPITPPQSNEAHNG